MFYVFLYIFIPYTSVFTYNFCVHVCTIDTLFITIEHSTLHIN
jgi:hypothetical protein